MQPRQVEQRVSSGWSSWAVMPRVPAGARGRRRWAFRRRGRRPGATGSPRHGYGRRRFHRHAPMDCVPARHRRYAIVCSWTAALGSGAALAFAGIRLPSADAPHEVIGFAPGHDRLVAERTIAVEYRAIRQRIRNAGSGRCRGGGGGCAAVGTRSRACGLRHGRVGCGEQHGRPQDGLIGSCHESPRRSPAGSGMRSGIRSGGAGRWDDDVAPQRARYRVTDASGEEGSGRPLETAAHE